MSYGAVSSKYYLSDQMNEDEKDVACHMYWEKRSSVFWWRNVKERDCIDRAIIIMDLHVRVGGHRLDESGSG